MFRAIGLAVADLTTWPVISILLQAIRVSLLVFVVIAGLLIWLLAGTDPCSMFGLGSCTLDAGSSAIGVIGLTVLAAWFLFPAVAITVVTTFTDRVVSAVEERHYPEAAKMARPVGMGRGLLMGLKSAGRLLLFNLLALPFYLLLLFSGVGPFVLFVIVNGIAFGRDLAELAAARHGDSTSRRAWLKDMRGNYRLIGVVVSVLFLVPFANLVAPVIGAAAGVHLFNHSFWRMRPSGGSAEAPRSTS